MTSDWSMAIGTAIQPLTSQQKSKSNGIVASECSAAARHGSVWQRHKLMFSNKFKPMRTNPAITEAPATLRLLTAAARLAFIRACDSPEKLRSGDAWRVYDAAL